MRVGLIGLGNMGFQLGLRLLAGGCDLIAYDASPGAAARLRDQGARIAANSKDLASQVELVLLCLPLPTIVREVAIGAGNVIDGSSVRVVVDLSTTGPTVTKEIARDLEARNIILIGSPISGGTAAAAKGTLAIMPSGDAATCKEIEPILQMFGNKIFYLGPDPSLGQTMKIINNTLYATSMLASCEALVFGVKAGLDSKAMLDVLNASSGRSFATLERIPQCALDRSFPVRFTTSLLHKDISLCIDEAQKMGVPMMVSPAARQFLAFAITQGDGEKDNVHTIRHFEQWAGVQFGRAPDV